MVVLNCFKNNLAISGKNEGVSDAVNEGVSEGVNINLAISGKK